MVPQKNTQNPIPLGQADILAHFRNVHLTTLGHPYMVNWGKDNRLIRDMFTTYGYTSMKRLVDLFFESIMEDEFLKRTGASIGILKSQLPKLLMKLNKDDGRPKPSKPTGRL